MDLGGAWRSAEDFLRRHIKSRAVRSAETRRLERASEAAWRATRKAVAFGGLPAAGAFGYAMTVAPLGAAAAAAGAAALAGLAAARLWTGWGRSSAPFSAEELAALPGKTEDWLLDKRPLLPRAGGAPLDLILDHLGELQPRLRLVDSNVTIAWDARRLIGEHLPDLVDSWCGLPASTRERDAEARRRLVEGLTVVAGELGRLLEELTRDDRMRLETQRRFLEMRYKDPGEGH
jgi:hypothetical protein